MYGKNRSMDRGKGSISSTSVAKEKGSSSSSSVLDLMEKNGGEIDIQQLLKDIEFLGSSHMSWKERKELENRKVVSLGGKAPKKHRTPLSVAKVTMKKQKDREQKSSQEGLILGHFGGRSANSNTSRGTERRKAEDRVLRTTEGHFSKGVLDVKDLLRRDKYGGNDRSSGSKFSRPVNLGGGGGPKKGGGKHKGKKKGGKKGGKKRR
ncbi:hypothetical protein ACHQM5_013106 [Ranunculus cassubicifolius]